MANEARNVLLRPHSRFVRGTYLLNAQATTGVSSLGTVGLGGPYTSFSLMAYRATTSLASASTKPSYRLQGSVDGTLWHTIGAATRAITVKSSAPTLTVVSASAAVAYVRAVINNFSTSNGSTLAGSDKVAATVKILPG